MHTSLLPRQALCGSPGQNSLQHLVKWRGSALFSVPAPWDSWRWRDFLTHGLQHQLSPNLGLFLHFLTPVLLNFSSPELCRLLRLSVCKSIKHDNCGYLQHTKVINPILAAMPMNFFLLGRLSLQMLWSLGRGGCWVCAFRPRLTLFFLRSASCSRRDVFASWPPEIQLSNGQV